MTSYALDWLAKDMTLRDYFAAQALGGLVASSDESEPIEYTLFAKEAYRLADAMLKEMKPPTFDPEVLGVRAQ